MLQSRPLFPQKRTRSHSQPFFQHAFFMLNCDFLFGSQFLQRVSSRRSSFSISLLRAQPAAPRTPRCFVGSGLPWGSVQGTNERNTDSRESLLLPLPGAQPTGRCPSTISPDIPRAPPAVRTARHRRERSQWRARASPGGSASARRPRGDFEKLRAGARRCRTPRGCGVVACRCSSLPAGPSLRLPLELGCRRA